VCQHEFQNVQYLPVKQRRFQDIRIEFLTTDGSLCGQHDAQFPQELPMVETTCVKYGEDIYYKTFITMHP